LPDIQVPDTPSAANAVATESTRAPAATALRIKYLNQNIDPLTLKKIKPEAA